MQEARRYERKAVALRPRYRVATRLDYAESPCLDLSEGGMFIESPAPAAPGTLVKVECSGEHGVLRALGTVAWRRDEGTAPSGMGIRFLKIEPGGGPVLQALLASTPGEGSLAVAMPRVGTWLMTAAVALMLVGTFLLYVGSR